MTLTDDDRLRLARLTEAVIHLEALYHGLDRRVRSLDQGFRTETYPAVREHLQQLAEKLTAMHQAVAELNSEAYDLGEKAYAMHDQIMTFTAKLLEADGRSIARHNEQTTVYPIRTANGKAV